ncbi:MAG: hypothetical protein QOK48_3140 [Blastocatellia bacterium]|jgi:hypothetical protein|nr:hypothetical protein [Blastocatellia bacterium]
MSFQPQSRPEGFERYAHLNAGWEELCKRYLPVVSSSTIWRQSRPFLPRDPEQGWKLHIPATVLTANRVMQILAPFLSDEDVLYKAPASLRELSRLNSGVFYGYSQVGKFLTVYPQSNHDAVRLANQLYKLTRRMPAPAVPFDLRYRADGCVYYRYGAFRILEMPEAGGTSSYAIRDPEGNLIPDRRESPPATPGWVSDPFPHAHRSRPRPASETPLKTTFKAFRALTQRGKGGVYQAVDLSSSPPRLCVLKEGRKHGEVTWDGRDGFWRVRHEGHVLAALHAAGLNVPRVYRSFKAGQNYFLALEFIEGESLAARLGRRKRKLTVKAALKIAAELARIVAGIHAAGWAWRDCKPNNFIITESGELRPLDFEGACELGRSDPLPWSTPDYAPPEIQQPFSGQSRLPEDLYALGATIHLLLIGRPPGSTFVPLRNKNRRREIPAGLVRLINQLLDPDPSQRPPALSAAQRLESASSSMKRRAAKGKGSCDEPGH